MRQHPIVNNVNLVVQWWVGCKVWTWDICWWAIIGVSSSSIPWDQGSHGNPTDNIHLQVLWIFNKYVKSCHYLNPRASVAGSSCVTKVVEEAGCRRPQQKTLPGLVLQMIRGRKLGKRNLMTPFSVMPSLQYRQNLNLETTLPHVLLDHWNWKQKHLKTIISIWKCSFHLLN